MSASSILQEMTAQITGEKKQAAAGLTPVKGEARPEIERLVPVHVHAATFPNDYPTMAVSSALAIIKAQLSNIAEAVAAIEAQLAVPLGDAVPQDVEQTDPAEQVIELDRRLQESEQAKFAADFAEKTARAKAETFPEPTEADPLPEVRVTNVDGWTCPTHGEAAIENKVSPKGRKYRKCTAAGCAEFEKGR